MHKTTELRARRVYHGSVLVNGDCYCHDALQALTGCVVDVCWSDGALAVYYQNRFVCHPKLKIITVPERIKKARLK